MLLNGASKVEVEKSSWIINSIALFPTTSSASSMRTMSHPALSHWVCLGEIGIIVHALLTLLSFGSQITLVSIMNLGDMKNCFVIKWNLSN